MMPLAALLGLLFVYSVDFRNIAPHAGLTRSIPNGGDKSKRWILETTGSGVALFDYDNDGLLDAFLVSGEGGPSRLYHNEGRTRFVETTVAMGLANASGWGQGVCAADYNNDGFTDLYVTYWGQNRLYRNVDGKRFEDVTKRSGLTQDRVRYNTGCAFLDYDRDGHTDLFVSNYLKFDFNTTPQPGANPYCFYRETPVSCGPRGLPFDRNILFRNNGDGTFTDVSESSGISRPSRHYALGVATGDFNGDGFTDIYVACDQTPSLLYINRGNGTFEDQALFRGAALDENGKALSGMGVAVADYDNDGWLDIFRTNFSDERETLYRNRGRGEFDDATTAAGMAHNTRFVGWGSSFFDLDNDGWQDLLLVNGHVFPEVDRIAGDIRYKDRAILYRNLGNSKFADVSTSAGSAILENHAARGAAFGDIDNDGVIEILVNNQNEPPSLFRQSGSPPGRWIQLHLTGTRSNRSALGAKVKIVAAGKTQHAEVRSGGSYLSHNDLRLHFGLGNARIVERIEIDWPSGTRQVLLDVPASRILHIEESRGN